jgi:hypothetical protein
MDSIIKMAILHFPISPSEPCIFSSFKTKNFKFWILIENCITTNDTSFFYYKKKHLIREGPNSSSIPELLDNLSKNLEVSFVVI